MDGSRLAFATPAFRGTFLVGCDVIGPVAFDLVWGILWRRAVHVTLAFDVSGIDRDDRSRDPTSL
jgi:hypothetical protein